MRVGLWLGAAALTFVQSAIGASSGEAAPPSAGGARSPNAWFEQVKKTATPEQLYTFLYALPKGGDLHDHLSGAARSEWMWEAALAQEKLGYIYYTKVAIRNCMPYGTNEYGPAPYLLLFRNVTA